MRYLRHAREQKQLSQDQLAELSGVPQNTISLIKRTAEERQAYIGVKREAGALSQLIANLEEIFEAANEEAANEDSSGYPLRLAQLESAFLLGYARATEDAAQLEHDGH